MGKIVLVSLKLYAEDNPDLEHIVMLELKRILKESPMLILSSIKSLEVLKGVNIDFKMNKAMDLNQK